MENKPVQNEVLTDEALLRRYQKQINRLTKQVEEVLYGRELCENYVVLIAVIALAEGKIGNRSVAVGKCGAE